MVCCLSSEYDIPGVLVGQLPLPAGQITRQPHQQVKRPHWLPPRPLPAPGRGAGARRPGGWRRIGLVGGKVGGDGREGWNGGREG